MSPQAPVRFAVRLADDNALQGQPLYFSHVRRGNTKRQWDESRWTVDLAEAKTWATREAAERNADLWASDDQPLAVIEVPQ